jgi:hypothetical protein
VHHASGAHGHLLVAFAQVPFFRQLSGQRLIPFGHGAGLGHSLGIGFGCKHQGLATRAGAVRKAASISPAAEDGAWPAG